MPAELKASKCIVRKLPVHERGRQLVVKISAEGVYYRWEGQRWSSALYLPWMMGYTRAAWRRAEELKKERAAKRAARRGGL